MFVQFKDKKQKEIVSVFGCAQDSESFENLGEVDESDQRYIDFMKQIKGEENAN